MNAPQGRPLTGAVAAAVARVLEVNPGLLRWDTPLGDIGADDVALVMIADVLIDGGYVRADAIGTSLPQVTTYGELCTAVAAAADADGAGEAGATAESTGAGR